MMIEISPFSPEYNIGRSTDVNKKELTETVLKPTGDEDIISKIENNPHYKLSKPVRITIKARVIPK